jgi:chemotaxis protein CheZ
MGASVQRKVFRIEQMLDSTPERAPARAADKPQNIGRELAQMRDTIVRNKRELMNLHGGANEPRMIRAAFELGAAIDGMEKATQTILKSTEAIDESAKTLAVTLQSGYEHGLAQEIQEQTVRIYEACNFQDLAGQRIGKAIAALQTIEEHVTRMLAQWDEIATAAPAAAPSCEPTLINGPKLDGDKGHATQRDIDAMFG